MMLAQPTDIDDGVSSSIAEVVKSSRAIRALVSPQDAVLAKALDAISQVPARDVSGSQWQGVAYNTWALLKDVPYFKTMIVSFRMTGATRVNAVAKMTSAVDGVRSATALNTKI
eukprot:8224469-Pyramimonas_sp.AAC.1